MVSWEDQRHFDSRLLSAHLEECYKLSLEESMQARPQVAALCVSSTEDTRSGDAVCGDIVEALVARASLHLDQRSRLWGVDLCVPSPERRSLLTSFLGARDWDLEATVSFLRETMNWRREEAIDGIDSKTSDCKWNLPEDEIRTISGSCHSDVRQSLMVIVSIGKVSLEALRDVEEFVRWRVCMQERACSALKHHWRSSPHGPKYTLVLDCHGIRPYHFGCACRKALSQLSFVFTHYYPDFVGETLVINAPGFLRAAWRVVEPLMPAWWGVRLVDTLPEGGFEKRRH